MKKRFSFWTFAAVTVSLFALYSIFTPVYAADAEAYEPLIIRQSGFETGREGWSPRGDVHVEVTSDVSRSGNYSLFTSGRTDAWNGASLDMLEIIEQDVKYDVAVWVRLAAGEDATVMRMSYQLDRTGENTVYQGISNNVEVTDGGWTLLEGTFTLVSGAEGLSFYVESDSGLASFYIDDFRVEREPPKEIQLDVASLRDLFADSFKIGAAVEPYQLSTMHSELLLKHYNSLTAENVMKPINTQPEEGNFTFADMNQILDFAKAHGMAVRYHTLVWHSQVPDWFFYDEAGNQMTGPGAGDENKALLLDRLVTHVETIVRHVEQNYPGVVTAWDVVNEAIDTSHDDGLRRNQWYNITGDDYIRVAFNTTHRVLQEYGRADDAVLVLNDYSTSDPAKRDAMYNVATRLRSDGVPIQAIGHQLHVNIQSPGVRQIEDSIAKFAAAGFDNQVTELDVSIYTDETGSYPTFDAIPENIFVKQAYRFVELFEVLDGLSADISNVTFWGVSDDHTWLTDRPIPRKDAPFVFDKDGQAKHAYWALADPSRLPPLIQEANAIQGVPTIDGTKELAWEAVASTALPEGGQLAGSFRTQWDAGHLYLWVDVADPITNPADKVVVFVADAGASRQFTFARDGSSSGHYIVQETDGGYSVEAAIALNNRVSVGEQLRFDLRIEDADQTTRLSWNDPNGEQEVSTAHYGMLTLLPAIKISSTPYGTPVIDAKLDDVWLQSPVLATDVWVMGEDGSTAQFRTLWDEGHLYVFAEVTDRVLSSVSNDAYQQDSVEIFLDQNNEKTTYYQPDDRQYRVSFENVQSFAGAATPDTLVTATRVTDTGYMVEAAIKLDIEPTDGTVIGFDFQVNNDENGDGLRDSVAMWNDPTGQSYLNTSRLGVLFLTKGED